jgi:hypothetical protein
VKQRSRRFYREWFILWYRVEVSDRSVTLEDLDTEVEIISACEMIRENVKLSTSECLWLYELEKPKPWFDDGCSNLLDQRKQDNLQWIQDPSEINGDNLPIERCEARRHFRNKQREYLKYKINKLATNSNNKNIRAFYRGINEFKTGYQR